MSMDAAAIQKIIDLTDPLEHVIGGRTYTARKLIPITEPLAETLTFHTLGGASDYLHRGPDKFNVSDIAVAVLDPGRVDVVGQLNGDRARETLANARLAGETFPFGQWQDHETAMIGIQSLFVNTDERVALLKALGCISGDEIRTSEDDGVGQSVKVKAGVHLRDRLELPSPVTLRPYRTFREVEQPASDFVLRVKKGPGGVLLVALHEADGGAWKLEAIKNVATWLKSCLPDGVAVLA